MCMDITGLYSSHIMNIDSQLFCSLESPGRGLNYLEARIECQTKQVVISFIVPGWDQNVSQVCYCCLLLFFFFYVLFFIYLVLWFRFQVILMYNQHCKVLLHSGCRAPRDLLERHVLISKLEAGPESLLFYQAPRCSMFTHHT